MPELGSQTSRRKVLSALGVSSVALAGCMSGEDGSGSQDGEGDDSGSQNSIPDTATFAGGGSGGAWSLGAATWSEFAREEFDVSVTSRDGGGEANIVDVVNGDVDIAWTFSNTLHKGYNGDGNFPEEFDQLRAIGAVWPAPAMTVAVPDVNSYSDLEGRTIAPGKSGFSGYAAALMILDYYDVSEDDVDIVAAGYSEMTSLYQDGQVDSLHLMGSIPHSVPQQGLSRSDGKMLPMSDDVISEITSQEDGWANIEIPAGTFPNASNGDQAVPTAGTYTVIFTRESMSEEVVYTLTKKNFEEKDRMVNAHSVYDQMTAENATKGISGLPFHPGAKRALNELGIDI